MGREEKYKAFVENDLTKNKGQLVNACAELEILINNPVVNSVMNKHYLNAALSYATTFSDYYKRYKGFNDITDFPIVDKQFLKDHYDQILVREYELNEGTIEKYTSGSTGTPFKMTMDQYKHSRWIAANKVFRSNVGVKSHEKTLFVSETVQDKKIPMERMEKDNVYYVSCKFLDDKSVARLIEKLERENFRTMTALASVWDRIAHMVKKGGVPEWKGNFIAVFSVSEPLKETTRQIIEEYFRCPIYVLYANEENGVLGVEDGSQFGCRANEADFFFEVLSMESNNPAQEGEIGRLVITDLFNRAFPMIRYENGDLVAVNRNAEGKLYFSKIAGRKADTLYTTDGRPVHYFEGISFLEPYMDIKQFQLIQYDYDKFKWVLNTNNHEYEEMIVCESKKLFGVNARFTFEYVDEIPKLQSGKMRMTVCKIPDKMNASEHL